MTQTRTDPPHDPESLPRMPRWLTAMRCETPEDMAFLSGAALAHLGLVLDRPEVPRAVLRERLALRASVACAAVAGRSEGAAALRDTVHLLRPGDSPGPAGQIHACWRRAVARPLSVKAMARALPDHTPDQVARWLGAGQGSAVAQAAAVLAAVLSDNARAETAALVLGDAALARALGWDRVVPLLAAGLKRRDLRATGEDLRRACHRAVVASAVTAVRMAADLARRADKLRSVAPRLRARGASDAVALFLTRDALAPTALVPLMSDRAARRLCTRLADLGAVQELTGRDSFRLYGI